VIKFSQNCYNAGGEKLLRYMNSFILFGIRRDCIRLHQFRRKVIKLIMEIIMEYYCYHLDTKCHPISFSPHPNPIDEVIVDHQWGCEHNRSTTDQILHIHELLMKKLEYNKTFMSY
jgi:hypothetical protein